VRISVTASDAESGIAAVVFYYDDVTGLQRSRSMFKSGSTYIARLDATKDPIGPPAVSYSIVARNGAGLTTQTSARFAVIPC
jgi:hypothetical protein